MEAGAAERASISSPYGMHDSEGTRRKEAAGTAAEDPRSCAEMRQDPDSGAECRKEDSGVLLGATFGKVEGWFCLFCLFSPRGERGPELLPGGGPVSRKPQTLIFAAA